MSHDMMDPSYCSCDECASYRRHEAERAAHLFDISVSKLLDAEMEVRKQLIEVQLQEYPDSLILTHDEMLNRWLNFDKVPYMQTREEWQRENGIMFDKEEKYLMMREYNHYVDRTRANYAQRVLRSLAIAHQHPTVVFYECGKQADGTYQWRGARYGVEGHQYASGFGS